MRRMTCYLTMLIALAGATATTATTSTAGGKSMKETFTGDEGTGRMVFAAQVHVRKKGTVELENFGAQPARLAGVRQR